MKRVLILVEGQTEERFIKTLLSEELYDKDICLIPTILQTKNVKDGASFKGGLINYAKFKNDVSKLLFDTNCKMVTSMIDLYQLPTDFPSYDQIKDKDCFDKVKILEDALKLDIDNEKFIPYIQLHEFEALLFSSIDDINTTLSGSNKEITELKKIITEHSNPEEINHLPETCPSKRISKIFPSYKKVLYGTNILKRIGIKEVRGKCHHFNEWVTNIENI